MTTPLLILIAGPYRSGTGGDPAAIARNLARLEAAAAPIYRLGHVPMIGEWVALPILRGAADDAALGSDGAADGDVMYETARRLLQHCDAVLRLSGESSGADTDVMIARERGIPVYVDLADIPAVTTAASAPA
ncbi:MAG TPA: DUF4406 domain-containing protein [Plantibacter sp.]|uniref:DUF4406 domain-containing protein n=1 Tax=unclassified Plantibacter TaxID=2624265 RepID=UPI002C56B275|nr:DUF4406 domain-containing protein [Plantibacter sp.]